MNITVFVNLHQEINENWDAVITNMSEDDKAGIEFALQLKEKNGGKVTAVTIGTEDADIALREAFAMGVDNAALALDQEAGEESAEIIAATLGKIGGDVFVAGRQDEKVKKAAELLKAAEKQAEEVDLDHFTEPTPCFVFASASAFKPRHMQVGGVYSAYQKEVECFVVPVPMGSK